MTTQTSLPARSEPVKAYDVVVLKVDAMVRRVLGGIMSRKAEIRSQMVSSCRARPRSETSESSEKSDCAAEKDTKQKQKEGKEKEVSMTLSRLKVRM